MNVKIKSKRMLFLLFLSPAIYWSIYLEDKVHWSDENYYINCAMNLHWDNDSEVDMAHRCPGYSLLLSMFLNINHDPIISARVLNILCLLITGILSVKVLKILNFNYYLLCFVCILCYPFYIYVTGFALSETLMTLCVIFTLYLLLKMEMYNRNYLICFFIGFMLGIFNIVRPVFIFLPLFYVIFNCGKLIKYKSIRVKFYCFICSFLITIASWMMYNYVEYRIFGLSSNTWHEVYRGAVTHPLGDTYDSINKNWDESDYKNNVIKFIKNEPMKFILYKMGWVVRFWSPLLDNSTNTESITILSIVSSLILLPIYVLAIIGLIIVARERRNIINSVVVSYWFFYVISTSRWRYRLPIDVILLILAVIGIQNIKSLIKKNIKAEGSV